MPLHPDSIVFPTPVGVFPAAKVVMPAAPSLPHARGGVSGYGVALKRIRGSSPRPWGCFCSKKAAKAQTEVFPTPVGVFPTPAATRTRSRRLPHARGGVSWWQVERLRGRSSSPRPWGCFSAENSDEIHHLVFPTPVGVFPVQSIQDTQQACLPHARGGVSRILLGMSRAAESSPRPWGCFLLSWCERRTGPVFPTPVGVFLCGANFSPRSPSLPHARGGVSGLEALAVRVPESSPRPWGCF
ncbi:hypothetical protein A6D6_00401 [Alcanivorax xiamenensis]|uniref:Uncharacterized protein n=1 Tax=Alcanivorax xiamenensis TaxID=1177156 RepID=A0ABQ6YCR4_9GAMM|nr:hypothetical protein A6D6_00401 [Alcanivorax xiamenensis]